jgi:propionyl-CoA synthetase
MRTATHILGRTDDVINVAGHRLGTREIEEAIQGHPAIAEVAVVGVADQLKGQMPMAFRRGQGCCEDCHARTASRRWRRKCSSRLTAFSAPLPVRPRAFRVALPKTRSGKMLRRSIQALAEGRDPGDLTTIEDPADGRHRQT